MKKGIVSIAYTKSIHQIFLRMNHTVHYYSILGYRNLITLNEACKVENESIEKMARDIKQEASKLLKGRIELGRVIARFEEDLTKTKTMIDAVLVKKENIHRKYMEKKVKLKDLYEHWRVLHSMVRIGAYHYRNIMFQIHQIRDEIIRQRYLQYLNMIQTQMNIIFELKLNEKFFKLHIYCPEILNSTLNTKATTFCNFTVKWQQWRM